MNFKTFRLLSEEFIRKVNSQLGSNPGGIHTHLGSGKDYYIKFPRDPEQAKVEVATSRIYNQLGIKTLEPELKDIGGRIGVISKWRDDLHVKSPEDFHSAIETNHDLASSMVKLHIASALTGNQDSIGLFHDNVIHHPNGDSYSIDQGGSMHFRAMGEHKEFGNDAVPLYHSLLDQKRPSGRVFSHAYTNTSPDHHRSSIDALRNLTDDKIDNIMRSVALDTSHGDIIKKRRDSLLALNNQT